MQNVLRSVDWTRREIGRSYELRSLARLLEGFVALEVSAPLKDPFVEIASQQLYFVTLASRQHRDDVISVRLVGDFYQSSITPRRARYMSLLPQVNSAFGRHNLIRAARLDLNEDKCVAIVGNCVDLGSSLLAAQSATERDSKVGGDYSIAFVLDQVIEGRALAAFAQFQMLGTRGSSLSHEHVVHLIR